MGDRQVFRRANGGPRSSDFKPSLQFPELIRLLIETVHLRLNCAIFSALLSSADLSSLTALIRPNVRAP